MSSSYTASTRGGNNVSRTGETSFADLYSELRAFYPGLRIPLQRELAELDADYRHMQAERSARVYMAATITAVFMLISVPTLVTLAYQIAASVQVVLSPYLDQTRFLNAHQGLTAGLVLGALGALVYALLMHSDLLARPLRSALRGDMKKSGWQFRLFQVSMVYFAVGIGIVLLHSFVVVTQPYSGFATRLWILMPMAILTIFPTLVVGVLLSIAFLRGRKSEDSPYIISLREILLLLRLMKDASHPRDLSISDRLAALSHISATAASLRHLYTNGEGKGKGFVAAWTKEKMNRVASNFLALSSWVTFPMADSVSTLKNRLVFYANVLEEGALHDLPAEAVDESFPFLKQSRRRGYVRRFGSLVWLLLLVTLPLLVYMANALLTGKALPDALHTPAAIAYSAWVAACLLAHLEELAPEAKGALLDAVKIVFRR